MTEKYFRELRSEELATGTAVWLQGKSFLDTSPVAPVFHSVTIARPVCGPFLIEKVLFGGCNIEEPRVDLVDPATGDRRSMMRSWLLVPREES